MSNKDLYKCFKIGKPVEYDGAAYRIKEIIIRRDQWKKETWSAVLINSRVPNSSVTVKGETVNEAMPNTSEV